MSGMGGIPETSADAKSGRSVTDILESILIELRGIRLACVHLATEGGLAAPDDFNISKAEVQSAENAVDGI